MISNNPLETFSIKIGIGGSAIVAPWKSYFVLEKKTKTIIGSDVSFSEGVRLKNESGYLNIGEGVSFNRNCIIFVKNRVNIGKNCLFGWNVNIRDNDGHKIIYSSNKKSVNSVNIGEHVWVTADNTILKGTEIGDNSVVGTGSIVNKEFKQSNQLLIGRPAKCIRQDINWKE